MELLYINTPYDDFKSTDEINKKIEGFLNKVDGNLDRKKHITIRNDYSIEKGILSYGERQKVDLIVVPTHGRKGLSHFFAGSIGEDIVNHSILPIMTFKI